MMDDMEDVVSERVFMMQVLLVDGYTIHCDVEKGKLVPKATTNLVEVMEMIEDAYHKEGVTSSNNTGKRKKNNSFSLSPEKDSPETRQRTNTLPSDFENSLESSQESYVLPVHKKKKETPIYSKLLKEGLRSKHLINENELITQFKWLQDNHNDYVSAENFHSTRDVELLIKSLLKCQTAVLVCIEMTYSTELHVSHQFLNNFRTEYMIFPVKDDFCILMRTF